MRLRLRSKFSGGDPGRKMPVGTRELASSGKRTDLYRWKRFSKKPNPKHGFDSENLEYWTKRVEKASEFAVSEVFFPRNSDVPRKPWGKVIDLEAREQLVDHDETHEEAQKLLNDWMNSKLKMELTSDKEDNGDTVPNVTSSPGENGVSDPVKYEKFDDLCGHLEDEEESTTVKQFINHLLHKDIVDSGILEDLGIKENQEKKKHKDPRLTMEMRHKQVKENRLRRQKELERQKAEKALKKSALLEAQHLVQEEKKRKALKVKKEEEEIQKEMVKLRKQMVERRRIVQEAWKIERKKQEETSQKCLEKASFQNAQVLLNEEKVAKEKKKKRQELIVKINMENHQCLQKYFSAWKKVVFEHKFKMKKAQTLADWKCQMKFLQTWREYTRIQKLARETQAMEASVKEQVRKQQLATDVNRSRILRHYFIQWQHLYRKETGRRELELKKEETRKKMDELLKAASLGKLSSNGSCDIRNGEKRKSQNSSTRKEEVPVTFSQEKPSESDGCITSPPLCKKSKSLFQARMQQAPQNLLELPQSKTPSCESLHQICSSQQSRTPSQKPVSPYMGHFHNRHIFQQQVIEEQKKKLQEQQKIILELQENQRLREAREEAERATAVTAALTQLMSNPREEKMKKGCHITSNSPCTSSGMDSPKPDSQSSPYASRRKSKPLLTPHPILKAMEERAAQRSERKKLLAEIKKKQEEEKLVQLKAQEEARQRKEAEEKEIQLEKRREEKRLKKMRELEKQRRAERNQQLQAKAKRHHEQALLRRRGLEPWKRLLSQSKRNMEVAESHYYSTIQRKYLLRWFHYNQERLAEKKAQADKLYSQILLKRAFRNWLEYKDSLAIAEEKARKFSAVFLQKNIFMSWLNMVREEKIVGQKKLQIAIEHSNRGILSTVFQTWKKLPKLMKEEKLKEERREELRKKVTEILPDFRTVSSV